MNKTIIAILIAVLLIATALYFATLEEREEIETDEETEEVEELGETEGVEEDTEGSDDLPDEEETETEEGEVMGDSKMSNLVDCLKEEGVVIYGSMTCPACAMLVNDFGGKEKIDPIYVECAEEREKCDNEKETRYVPEIQIKGNLYEGGRNPEAIAEEVGCEI